MLRQSSTALAIDTLGRGLFEITRPIAAWVGELGAQGGLVTLFIRHTSASLLIQENAAPEVRADLDRFFARLVADGDAGLGGHAAGRSASNHDRLEVGISIVRVMHRALPVVSGALPPSGTSGAG